MKLLRECAWLLVLAIVPSLLSFLLHPKIPALAWTKGDVVEVELNETKQWPQPLLWVDARPRVDYEQRHIRGAILLNEDSWEELMPGFLAAWQPGIKVIVYCDSAKCDASKEVTRRLQRELNLPDIYALHGGWSSWLQSQP